MTENENFENECVKEYFLYRGTIKKLLAAQNLRQEINTEN